MGPLSNSPDVPSSTSLFALSNDDLHRELQEFWHLEEPTFSVPADPQDDFCEEHFKNTHQRTPQRQYIVRLPFKDNVPSFVDSQQLQRKRFLNLEHKLKNHPSLKLMYHAFIKEYIDLNHMTQASSSSKFVIPHHAVLKTDGTRSKLRVVFDGSAKCANGSLNDYLLPGRKLQKDIREILLNFRSHKVAFVTDIVKMFRGIFLHPEDRGYQHVLWRFDPSEPVMTYELNTITYGLTSSPYLALRVIQQLCADEGHQFPKAAEVVLSDIYVDDLATGADSVKAAIDLQKDIINLLKAGTLSLSKWASNSKEVLFAAASHSSDPIPVFSDDTPNLKILGLQWNPADDCFSYSIHHITPVYTKRGILSAVAKIYDPLGFLSPIVMLLKSLVQDIWKEGLDWDQKVPNVIKESWDSWIHDLPRISEIRIDRFVSTAGTSYNAQILAFCDASSKGYCAAIYLRTELNSDVRVHLLTAKTRLAPVKTISIPRLELMGAVLLVRLYQSVFTFFVPRLKGRIGDPVFFTNSSIVLGWIHTQPHQLQTFVANRITEITSLTPVSSWRHVDSPYNPADCGSRGALPNDLLQHPLWWTGPNWLCSPHMLWPKPSFVVPEVLPEMKAKGSVLALVISSTGSFVEWMNRFSSFSQLCRVVAVLIRGISNFRARGKRIPCTGPLLSSELKNALFCCVKALQGHFFLNGNSVAKEQIDKLFKNLSCSRHQSGCQ